MRRTLLIFGILPFIHLQHKFWLKVKYMLCIVFISKDPSTRRDTKDPSTGLVVTLRNNFSSKQISGVYNLSKLYQIKKDHISWFKWLLTHPWMRRVLRWGRASGCGLEPRSLDPAFPVPAPPSATKTPSRNSLRNTRPNPLQVDEWNIL